MAAAIRAQLALTVDPAQAETLGRAIEASADDEELLAGVLGAVRAIVGALEPAEGMAGSGLPDELSVRDPVVGVADHELARLEAPRPAVGQ